MDSTHLDKDIQIAKLVVENLNLKGTLIQLDFNAAREEMNNLIEQKRQLDAMPPPPTVPSTPFADEITAHHPV